MIAGQNRNGYGDGHPLWIPGCRRLSLGDRCANPVTRSYTESDTPNTASGVDRTLEVRNFRSTKVGNFQSQLTGPTFRCQRPLRPPAAITWKGTSWSGSRRKTYGVFDMGTYIGAFGAIRDQRRSFSSRRSRATAPAGICGLR